MGIAAFAFYDPDKNPTFFKSMGMILLKFELICIKKEATRTMT